MNYNPNAPQYGYGGGYPQQQYQPTAPYTQQPNVVEYVQVTNYSQPLPPPPPQVVIVENQQQGGMGTVGTAMAGVALGMALEEALEF